IGESWFGVLVTSNSPLFSTNQAQPDPNRVAAAFSKVSLKASKLPHLSLILSANSPVGSPPPFGERIVQSKLWLSRPPPLLRTAVRLASGDAFESIIRSFNDLFYKSA